MFTFSKCLHRLFKQIFIKVLYFFQCKVSKNFSRYRFKNNFFILSKQLCRKFKYDAAKSFKQFLYTSYIIILMI